MILLAYMRNIARVILFVLPFLLAGLLYVIFQTTDPLTIGPAGILVVFIVLYLEFLTILFITLRFGRSWLRRIKGVRGKDYPNRQTTSSRRSYYIASIIAFVPVALLAVHSFSNIQVTDIILVAFLVCIGIFYIVKSH